MTFERSPEQIQAIFRQRAIRLAQKHAGSSPAAPGTPALIFRLSAERYAIALRDLAEVRLFERCTPVPGSRREFRGVINLRGELLPVVDLAQLVSGTASPDSGAILILRREIALKVDAIEQLGEIHSDEEARPGDPSSPAFRGKYVRAVLDGPLGLLDVEAIWSAVSAAKESRVA